MKCIQCDKCKKLIDPTYQGNKPPYYLYKTLFVHSEGNVPIERTSLLELHLCLDCYKNFSDSLWGEVDV